MEPLKGNLIERVSKAIESNNVRAIPNLIYFIENLCQITDFEQGDQMIEDLIAL